MDTIVKLTVEHQLPVLMRMGDAGSPEYCLRWNSEYSPMFKSAQECHVWANMHGHELVETQKE